MGMSLWFTPHTSVVHLKSLSGLKTFYINVSRNSVSDYFFQGLSFLCSSFPIIEELAISAAYCKQLHHVDLTSIQYASCLRSLHLTKSAVLFFYAKMIQPFDVGFIWCYLRTSVEFFLSVSPKKKILFSSFMRIGSTR